MDCQKFAAGQF